MIQEAWIQGVSTRKVDDLVQVLGMTGICPFLEQSAMITNQQLRDAFLNPQLKHYFDKKLAPLTSDEVDIRIEEALKFLNMAVHFHGQIPVQIPVSQEIDEIWHYWILETAEYQKLCAKLDGGSFFRHFLHHSSHDYAEYYDSNASNQEIELERGISILSSYVKNYGKFEHNRVKYWPLATSLLDMPGWHLDRLNEWLSSAFQPVECEAAE